MSFSSEVKESLSKMNNLAHKDEVKAEMIGYLMSANIQLVKNKIKYTTENKYNINRFGKLLSNLEVKDYKIEVVGKNYIITSKIPQINGVEFINGKILVREIEKSEKIKKAIIRGVFMGSGFINNPENCYHLEVLVAFHENLDFIMGIMNEYGIKGKTFERKKEISIYIKDGEEISKFLAFIGAVDGVIKFEEIRVLRETKNNINRIINCETANLNKIIDASIKQIEDIKFLKKIGKYAELSEAQKEVAELRIKNPDMSLVELGKLLKEPALKSAVNYRLNAISKKAEQYR